MRRPIVVAGLAAAWLAAVAVVVAASIAASGESDVVDDRFWRIGTRIEGLYLADSALTRRVESLDAHLADSVRISHERRAMLADELRRETAAAIAKEVAARTSDVAELAAVGIAIEADIKRLAEADGRILGRLDAVEKRLKAIEGRLKAVETKPIPAPVVISKTVQVPVYLPASKPAYVYPLPQWRCR